MGSQQYKTKSTDSSREYRLLRRGIAEKCSRCPAHDGENRTRRPKSDKYKSQRKGRT